MGRGLWTGLVRVAIACVILVGVGIAYLSLRTVQYDFDRRELEWAALTRSVHSLENGHAPEAWDFAVYVSDRGLNSALALVDIR